MRPLLKHLPLTACALATTVLISACGGGDASPPPTKSGTSGIAVDGYVSGGTVVCDTNGNSVADAGEATARTDSTGFFKFENVCPVNVFMTGGTSTDTGLNFVGTLRAPAGSIMLTPLTTLMVEGMTQDQINTAFGLPSGTNVTTQDPMINADLQRKTQAVQQVIQKMAETLAALKGAGADANAMYRQAAAAMAETLRSGGTLISADNTIQTGTVESVIKAGAARVALADVKPDTLARIMSSGLAAQAQAILGAKDSSAISAATKAQQGSKAVQEFVISNKSDLKDAPSAKTDQLKDQLVNIVGGKLEIPAGTLVSFDEDPPVFIEMGAYGGAQPDVVSGPTGGSGKALKIVKATSPDNWGGTYFGLPKIPFTADRKIISAMVYSSKADAVIEFKVEATDKSEIKAMSAKVPANTWTKVTWNLAGVDVNKSYAKVAITPDSGVTASGQTYYIDSIVLDPAAAPPEPVPFVDCSTRGTQCVSFTEATVGVSAFGGMADAQLVNAPDDEKNRVLRLIKGSGQGQEAWAGATIYTAKDGDGEAAKLTLPNIGLNTNKEVTIKVRSGAPVGTKFTIKLENSLTRDTNAVYAEAVTTKKDAWETLTFDLSKPSKGAVDSATVYNMATVFPAWSEKEGTQAVVAGDTTYHFDELRYAVEGVTPVPEAPTNAPTTTIPEGSIVVYSEASSNPGLDTFPQWGQATKFAEVSIASNKSLKYTDLNYQGLQFNAVDVSGKSKVRFDLWTPKAGKLDIALISEGKENAVTQSLTAGSWNSVEIDLSQYTVPDKKAIFQIKLDSQAHGADAVKTVFVDNIHFTGTVSSPTPSCGTIEPTCAPTTTIPEGSVVVYSEAASNPGLDTFPQWGQATKFAEVSIASNKSLKYTDLNYQGLQFNAVDVSGKSKVRFDLWTPKAGKLDIALISEGKENAVTQSLTAGSWNSVEIDLSQYTVPDKKAIFQIKLDSQAHGADAVKTVFVDNIHFTGSGSPTAPSPSGGTFSSGFASNVLTKDGGAIASGGGSNLDDWNCTGGDAWCGSGANAAGGVGADSSMYFYYQTPSAATGLYSQIEVFAPNVTGFNGSGDTAGVDVAGKAKVNFNFNPNPEWYQAGGAKVAVVLTLGKRFPIDNGCRLQLHGVKPITSDGNVAYSMNLTSDFRVAADCGQGIPPTDVAAALARSSVVSSVKFVGADGGAALIGRNEVKSTANLSVKAGNVYPTTVALKGAITFD